MCGLWRWNGGGWPADLHESHDGDRPAGWSRQAEAERRHARARSVLSCASATTATGRYGREREGDSFAVAT
jgi:hypothetical protein